MKKVILHLLILLPVFSLGQADFIATFKTDNPGASSNTSITIPITSTSGYQVDFNNDGDLLDAGEATVHTTNFTHDFGVVGTYTIRIVGNLNRILFNNSNANDPQKILSVDQWGVSNTWTNMGSAFFGCTNLTILATDAPNLSNCSDMNSMFRNASSFNQSIDAWDVSSVTNTSFMFNGASSFNQPLNSWNVSSVTNTSFMFSGASSFNQSLNSWDVSSVTNMNSMFRDASNFNQSIGVWNVSNVTNMANMFYGANNFNQSINAWNVSNVTNMVQMFREASSFNQPLSSWNVSNVTTIGSIFRGASSFNQSIDTWNVSNVTNMGNTFRGAASFNQPLNSWNVSNVTNMANMFRGVSNFNQSIGVWDVSNVTNMANMFEGTNSFNQPINSWNVSNVTNMSFMFRNASSFNQPLNAWNVSNVTDMSFMFENANSFNLPLNSWNVSNVTNMHTMFRTANNFNQSLGEWNIGNVSDMNSMLSHSAIDCANYDATLIGWEAQGITGLTLGASGLNYDHGVTARNSLTTTHGWSITGDTYNDGCNVADFIATFKTDNPGSSSNTSIMIPCFSTTGFRVDFNNDGDLLDAGEMTIHTTAFIHDFGAVGTYTIRIFGNLELVRFDNIYDPQKILSVDQWGTANKWTSMDDAFYGCVNLSILAIDTPDLSECTTLRRMFGNATGFNSSIEHWDVSNITNMSNMFQNATSFNQALDGWDVSNVITLANMFENATSFNQTLNSWNIMSVTNMSLMFRGASSFNKPLNAWDVSNVINVAQMFRDASSFNQPLNTWTLSSVTSINVMFRGASSFNQPLNSWNVSGITTMANLFLDATSFNQPLDAWNVSNVTNMSNLFNGASGFNQPLDSWDISSVTNMNNMLNGSGLSCLNYDSTLVAWEAQGVTGLTLGAAGLNYDNGQTARTSLTTTHSWTITGDAYSDGCSLALPIELLSFDVDLTDNKVHLYWQTASETNNNYFIVLRSKDGIQWEEIAMIKGTGNSTTTTYYQAKDERPILGTAYYKLKQYDFDGTFSYSKINVIHFKALEGINIYPNPSNGIITIANTEANQSFYYELMNFNGKVILKSTSTINEFEATEVNIEHLHAGVYSIRVFNENSAKAFRIIKK